MENCDNNRVAGHDIVVSDDVKSYILQRNIDFRVCTSCGGPILLSTTVKPPKSSDYEILSETILFTSRYTRPGTLTVSTWI